MLSFQGLGEIGDSYNQGNISRQQQEQNKLDIQRRQQQLDIAKTFEGGLPRDPRTGQIDYSKAVAMLAQKGDISALWNGADAMAIQGAGNLSPMLSGGAQPASQPQGQPASLPARPLPAPAANSPQGDAGSGTIASIVTDKMPQQDAATGQAIAKVAQLMGVDPNAALTPGQLRRAQGLVQRYASADGSGKTATTDTATAQGGGATFKDRFAAAGNGDLPPSANAGTPKAQAAPAQPQPALIGAGAPPQGGPGPQQAPQAAPQQPPANQPLRPQVPLPQGYTDPQAAILALRTEAARLSPNPRAKGQVDELKNWAERIEVSIQPVEMTAGKTMLDPRTGQPIYQGNQPTMGPDSIQAAAERYLQTGTLPPNMGRGVQGNADRNAIMNAASDLAAQRGINQADLPKQWQEFKSQQTAITRFKSGKQGDTTRSFNVLVDHLGTLTEAADALKNGNSRLLNQFKQNWAAQTGNPAPTNFDGVKALVGDEIVKAVVGSAGALADREEVKKDLDRASSPKQLAELVDRYRKLALGQLRGLRKQYESSTGLKDFGEMLLPGTLSALGGNKGEAPAPDSQGWVSLPNGARIREKKQGE
jgi:hypothetical protein